MTDRPTWQLVLDAARELTAAGRTPFRLSDLVAEVQRADPDRGRATIQPTVQGMTINAGTGPPAPCGKPLERVDHGYYRLASSAERAAPNPLPSDMTAPPARQSTKRRPRSLREAEVEARVQDVISNLERYVEVYDRDVPFTNDQYRVHRATIDRRLELGSVEAALEDVVFISLLRSTLQAWGIGRRASRLTPTAQFTASLHAHAAQLAALERFNIEDPDLDGPAVILRLDALIAELAIVDNRARIVAGTKTLHHLLPALVPPMDRAWTGAFFGWQPLDPQNHREAIFAEAFTAATDIALAGRPSRLVGTGWRTSPSKIVDNVIIGYCKEHGIGG